MSKARSPVGKYGQRQAQLNARLSTQAKAGLQKIAADQGMSVNEFLERLGRGLVSLGEPSGESLAS